MGTYKSETFQLLLEINAGWSILYTPITVDSLKAISILLLSDLQKKVTFKMFLFGFKRSIHTFHFENTISDVS